jgi:hypothetical protein
MGGWILSETMPCRAAVVVTAQGATIYSATQFIMLRALLA